MADNQIGQSPSSSIGIMRFLDVDTGGPKMQPEFIVVLCIAFVAIVLIASTLIG